MNELLRRQLDSSDTVFFSIVTKDSERGLTSNKRILFMVQNRFICYHSSPTLDFPLSLEYIKGKAKLVVPMNHIYKLNFKGSGLDVYFWVYQDGKRMERFWKFQMEVETLALQWQDVFDEYTNRSRKGTL